MDRYQEPADRDEAYAETSQEGLSVHDENWLTASTDEHNRRVDDRSDDTVDETVDDTVAPEDTEPGGPGDGGQGG